ncbi:proline iminopeptidase [Mollisia scopiformis]|uniref:Proline iminopeptidase n=1 Tax=Mollisia scopiformis TaxID=149040 RepID=A0A194XDY1_MOLSC|nr:proline iminopeptidase [Mollisia scopiformis]KUJ17957.1 proline iminopeptidase [Mollisia scopiformis]
MNVRIDRHANATVWRPPEGEIPFDVPEAGKPCHTWYKVVGDLNVTSPSIVPLITLHGGPGVCHELLGPLADLNEQYGIPVIFYDQIGNGKSTHIREKAGDEAFWSVELFMRELDNLIDYLGIRDGFDLYGQSWGGLLASQYATLHPKGLRKMILANSPASVELVLKGEEALRAALPKEVRETIERCEREGTTDSEEYAKALEVYRKRHICRIDPFPEEMNIAMRHMKEDPTVVNTMWGGDKLKPTGSLKDWTIIKDIPKIEVETFVLHGRYDQVQDISVIPFFELLPRVRWVTLEKSSHLPFFEERERYMELLGGFCGGFPK